MARLQTDHRCAVDLWALVCLRCGKRIASVFDMPVYILPAPSVSPRRSVDYWPAIWKNSLQTLYTTVVGFMPWRLPAAWRWGLLVGWSRFIYAGPLPADDRLQRHPEGRGCADPGDLVRHRHHCPRS
jgi:ABC-type nitrate/sulfonate/bicarbonate transport system permease component